MIQMVFACSVRNFLQRGEAVQQLGDVAEEWIFRMHSRMLSVASLHSFYLPDPKRTYTLPALCLEMYVSSRSVIVFKGCRVGNRCSSLVIGVPVVWKEGQIIVHRLLLNQLPC